MFHFCWSFYWRCVVSARSLLRERRSAGVTLFHDSRGSIGSLFLLQAAMRRYFAPGRAPFCAHKKGRKKRWVAALGRDLFLAPLCGAAGTSLIRAVPQTPHLRGISPTAPSTVAGARVLREFSGRPTLLHRLASASPAGCAGGVLLGIC